MIICGSLFRKILPESMDNPFKLFSILWRSRRPRRVADMPALRNNFWLRRKGYDAMTFYGTIITATQEEADKMNSRMTSLKRHEMIHLLQARSTCNSWTLFYIRYLWYYLRALPQNRRMKDAAYLLNPFEMEAYRHMYEADYLERCEQGAIEWRQWARMKPRRRLEAYQQRRR